MSIGQFLDASVHSPRDAAKHMMHASVPSNSLLYLQQSLLMARPDGPDNPNPAGALAACAGLGPGLTRDITEGIDMAALSSLAQAVRADSRTRPPLAWLSLPILHAPSMLTMNRAPCSAVCTMRPASPL